MEPKTGPCILWTRLTSNFAVCHFQNIYEQRQKQLQIKFTLTSFQVLVQSTFARAHKQSFTLCNMKFNFTDFSSQSAKHRVTQLDILQLKLLNGFQLQRWVTKCSHWTETQINTGYSTLYTSVNPITCKSFLCNFLPTFRTQFPCLT